MRSVKMATAAEHPCQEHGEALPLHATDPSLSLEADLAALQRLSLDDLRLRWRNHWGRLAPASLPRHLLFRLMAYRLQAEAFGDLDGKTLRLLEQRADEAANQGISEASPSQDAGDGRLEAATAGVTARRPAETLVLKLGAVLTREWQGRIERVMVVHDGFVWGGATYASLSAVAFAITGTKWSGLRFFGVRRCDRALASERRNDEKRTPARAKPADRAAKAAS